MNEPEIPRISTTEERAVVHRDPAPPVDLAPSADAAAEQAARDRAFDAEYEWNGQPLHGFALDRESLFAQLRSAVGAPHILIAIRDFDSFLADAFRILFICSRPASAYRHLRGDAGLFQEAVEAWAVANVRPDQRQLAVATAMNIYADATANEHEPAPASGSARREDEMGN